MIPPGTAATIRREHGSRPAGMTLPELLVSIAVAAILMAILIPALALFRESARKASCANNISRVGKGFTAFDMTQGQLPGWRNVLEPYTSANTTKRGNSREDVACVSWTVMLLPFIDERELADWYATYSPSRVADDVRRKRVDVFVCPVVAPELKTLSPVCFFANGGTGAMATDESGRQFTGDGVCLDAAGNVPSQAWHIKTPGSKEYYPGRYAFSDVAEGDGCSNTLLLAERTGPDSPADVSWADNPMPPAIGTDKSVSTMHAILHTRGIHPGYGQPGGGQSMHATMNTWMKTRGDNGLRYPSSRHDRGFMTVFCDGHVKFVSNSIDEWVYTQILTSDQRHLSLRVAMFQQKPTADGGLEPYIFSERDLEGP